MTGHFPGRPTIDGYGAGGFRFAGMSHRGSILGLPSGVYEWPVDGRPLTPADFTPVFNERSDIDLLLLGMGAAMARPPVPVRDAFAQSGMIVDYMATAAAIATYNLLLEEKRKVAAALIAVADFR